MKTAISIPDAIFEAAERLARQRRISRSELYTKAIAECVDGTRFLGVREQLDAIYASSADESTLDAAVARLQSLSVGKDDW